jgi:hypothetical protein
MAATSVTEGGVCWDGVRGGGGPVEIEASAATLSCYGMAVEPR